MRGSGGDSVLMSSNGLYEAIVACVEHGVVMKTMQNAADIVALRQWAAALPEDVEDRFAVLIVLHQLWTPSRMKYFMGRYLEGMSLREAVTGVDGEVNSALAKFEDGNLRAGLIKGQTNEAAITKLVTDHHAELLRVAKQLEAQWAKYDFAKLVKLTKQLPKFGPYHATHLIRSLTYAIPCDKRETMDWKTLTLMSDGVKAMASQLGDCGTPREFAERLSEDTGRTVEPGDIALILCEMKSAGILAVKDIKVPLSYETNKARRAAAHKKHKVPVMFDEDMYVVDACYISAKALIKCK